MLTDSRNMFINKNSIIISIRIEKKGEQNITH
jgi:hypothetical protein